MKGSKSCEVVSVESKHSQTVPCSSSMLAQPMKLSDNAEIEFLGTDGADTESLGSNETDVSDSLEVSSAQFEGDEVLVEDWVSDTNSKAAEIPNKGGLSPLAVKPLAFSLPLAMEEQEVVRVENPVRKESYSEWFQSRFNGFDNFLGVSLQGLENQATNFLLAVEAELHRRAALEKKARDLKSSRVKGIRELMGLFSSINYGSTSSRRNGINRERALSVLK